MVRDVIFSEDVRVASLSGDLNEVRETAAEGLKQACSRKSKPQLHRGKELGALKNRKNE